MLDARQLDAFAAVVEQGSFGGAAAALKLTLAAVSLRIKSLEAGMGQRLLVRGKQVRATPAGQALLGHVKRVRLMEADLLDGSPGDAAGLKSPLQSLSVAVNADSLGSWFLPGVAAAAHRHRLLLDIVIDDQDHTHAALSSGDVAGCVTALPQSIRGCVAEPLGVMRYRCVASPEFIARWGGVSRPAAAAVLPHELLRGPAVIFNRKDTLQDAFLAQHLNLRGASYPRHFVPAADAYETALELGMGWGMMSDLLLAARTDRPPLEEVLPGCTLDVMLYWQHWSREPAAAQRLTQAVKQAGLAMLRPAQ
jgi:LysR family transcriptional regulator, chromosome initiation inhibitor